MKTKERMTINERHKYLRLIQPRYRKASRQERKQLLDEMEAVAGLHRKSLIRLMNSDLSRKPRRKQRGRTYGIEVYRALRVIGESCDWICAERLQPNLVWLAEHLAKHGELEKTPELMEKLSRISIPTVRRILQRLRQDEPRLPYRGPKAGSRSAHQVPIRRVAWDEQEPGHFEVDLVHHCGPVTSGHYIHSLQMIDVTTGWSERVATLGRSYRVMRHAFQSILLRLPFLIQEIHSDNGQEFLQDHMIRFWQEEIGGVELSRGRPYRKNDQRFVEQKNSPLIRHYFGYERLDTVAQTLLMNRIYHKMRLHYNLFQPVMRLDEKTVITDEKGVSRVKRHHDQAQTPFERLCKTDVLSEEAHTSLVALRDRTNPRQLLQEIYQLLDELFALPGAESGKTESIFETLLPLCPGAQEEQAVGCGYVDYSPHTHYYAL